MKNEKNIITITANDLYDLYDSEIERVKKLYLQKSLQGMRDSNLTAQRKKCEFMQYLLNAVDGSTIITVEGCKGDGLIRDFCLTNSGSVVECIIKHLLTKATSVEKSWKTTDTDAINGFMAWEVKASLGAKFPATPSESELTLLVNLDGVSLIRKSEVLNYCIDKKDKNAKDGIRKVLPSKGLFGKRSFMVEYLTKALGLENGYHE